MKFTNRRIANTIIISTLLVASIASIGFSSWLIGKENSDSSNINASVGNVENNSLFTIRVVNMFTLGPDGLVEDYVIVSSSKIEAVFYIDNALAYEFSNSGSLKFKTELSCSDTTFLSTYIGANPTVSNSATVNSNLSGNTIFSDVTYIVASTGTSTVTITYEVNDNGTINTYYSNKPTFTFVVRSK